MRTSVALALAATSCSSQYTPRTPGRVAMVIRDGQQVYVRDGQSYDHGVLGGGLRDAVTGNRAAEAAADEYHTRMIEGLVGVLIGSLTVVGGASWATAQLANENASRTDMRNSLLLIGAGLVIETIGAGLAISAEPYRWDAINLFNDGAGAWPAPQPRWAPPGPPSASVVKSSLRMRD